MAQKLVKKEVDGFEGLFYRAWPKKELAKYPITEEHLGDRVWLAGETKTTDIILKEIHQPGDPYFPRGGFTIQEIGGDYPTDHFPDEVRAHAPKKTKARSRIARKIREGDITEPAIDPEYWDPIDAEETTKFEKPTIVSTDMGAAGASRYIRDAKHGELFGFIPEDEERVTVHRAWKEKFEGIKSTQMNAAAAAKFIRDNDIDDLMEFVPEDENRVTVKKAWENKKENSDRTVSTDMKAAEAAKYIRDKPPRVLEGFLADDETRKTVKKAWKDKPGV